jgi:lipopolysaccharide assembly outer membrane protein LptD (OstA)
MNIRRAIFVLAVLGLTGTVVAQTPTGPQPRQPNGRVQLGNGIRVTFIAGRAQIDGKVARLSGGVTVDIQGTKVIADEATVDMQTPEIRLHGDVRIR